MSNIIQLETLSALKGLEATVKHSVSHVLNNGKGSSYYIRKGVFDRDVRTIFANEKGSIEAIDLFKKYVYPDLLSDSDNWLFLVEGKNNGGSPEVNYFNGVARHLDLPIEDPVITPYHFHIAKLAGVTPIDGALSALILEHAFIDPFTYFTVYDTLSSSFNIPHGELEERRKYLKDRSELELDAIRQDSYVTRNKLFGVSNAISRLKLDMILSKYDSPKLFVHSRSGHSPLFLGENVSNYKVSIDDLDFMEDEKRRIDNTPTKLQVKTACTSDSSVSDKHLNDILNMDYIAALEQADRIIADGKYSGDWIKLAEQKALNAGISIRGNSYFSRTYMSVVMLADKITADGPVGTWLKIRDTYREKFERTIQNQHT